MKWCRFFAAQCSCGRLYNQWSRTWPFLGTFQSFNPLLRNLAYIKLHLHKRI